MGEPNFCLSPGAGSRRRQFSIGVSIAIPVEADDSAQGNDANPRACRADDAQQHDPSVRFSDLIQLQQCLESPQERRRIGRRVTFVVRIETRCNQLDVE